VIASETYVIPPQSETVIPAKIKRNVQPGTIGLIESTARLAGHYELQGVAALVKVAKDESVPFRLINPTNKPVTLYKGDSLGTFSEAPSQKPMATLMSLLWEIATLYSLHNRSLMISQ